MTLRLIVGRANIGKTGAALDVMRGAHAAGRNPVLVLPSQPDVRQAADELAETDSLGFRVRTFDAFLEDTWAQCGDERSIVAGAVRRLLASAAARKAGAGPGMGALAADCVTTLAEQLGEAWRDARPVATGTASSLIATIHHYRRSLEALGLVEREEAAFALSASPEVWADPLVIHRFIDFTPWQERFLVAIARTHEVIVTLAWEEGFAPTMALDGLVERLAAEITIADGEPFHMQPELTLVADGLFATPTRVRHGGALRFSLAEGHEAEAHRIAEEVRTAMAEYDKSGNGPSVAVVFRHPERHYRYLREAFDEAGIDAEFDVRLPLGSTTFGSVVLAMLGFVVSGDRDMLLSILKSPFSGGGREESLALERDWRRRGVVEPAVLIEELWRTSKGLQSIVRDAAKIARGCIDSAAAEALAKLVGKLLVLGYGREGAASQIATDDATAHAAALRVLSEVAGLDDSTILLEDVVDGLRRAIVTAPVEERSGVVQVTAVDRIRGRRYDTVIIGGLNADEFPTALSENMLPCSSVGAVLSAFGGSGQPQKGAAYEQLLFYMAMTRARQRVVLSARTADSDGDPAGLSPLFEAVADFCRPADDESVRPPAEFRALSQTPRTSNLATPRERLRATSQAAGEDPRSRAARWRSRSRVARLREDTSLEWLLRAEVHSPSAIDTYLACPYRWFYTRAVEPHQLESEFDASAQGSFAHDVLARAYRTLLDEGVARITPETLERGKEAVRAAWEAVNAERGPSGTMIERSERRATLMWAVRTIEYDASFAPGFSPSRLEWSFGFGAEDAVDMGGFNLRGVVDRVDSDGAGHAIVIDYKRSGGPSAADILNKRKIQVPLYFEAVRRGLGLDPVAGIYRGLRTCADRGLVLDGAGVTGAFKKNDIKEKDEFDSIVDGALELARLAVDGMRSGRIDQDPFDHGSCKKCDAFAVCGGAR